MSLSLILFTIVLQDFSFILHSRLTFDDTFTIRQIKNSIVLSSLNLTTTFSFHKIQSFLINHYYYGDFVIIESLERNRLLINKF